MQRNAHLQGSRFDGNSNPNASTFQGSRKTVNSENHPLTVSWIPDCETAAGGRLGLTFCPEKHITSRDGTQYSRDVGMDLARLRQVHAVHTIVCLLPEAELRYLKVRSYATAVEAHGMEYLHLPIIEMAAPSDALQAASVVDAVADRLLAGRTVVMHCKGGVGRAGMMAACMLVRLGVCTSPAEAIAVVRGRASCGQMVWCGVAWSSRCVSTAEVQWRVSDRRSLLQRTAALLNAEGAP
ncbi:hypothetical protein Vretimale_15535 [Volvox reticuliferus]|uniref:Tyrosine specific protein phosphatases domain-containing protein n=1 Tax=Volvox reticuliferus TaxID=1737510 RepID=A0A8J4LW96_9CHLO|nr:hypothetical protein Vretimale_15535 [Volvox reticuliferus]